MRITRSFDSSSRLATLRRLASVALLLLGMGAPMQGLLAASGQAVFVRGDVNLVQADGTRQPLQAGQQVAVGQTLEAGQNGYAHLRFPDGGFVGLRPGGRFVLEDYTIDASTPGGVRVRYRLDEGVVRAITGKAIEQHKDRFRMNTPVAAVGVRGTDYVVQTTADLTRASVSSGAIVLAPLGAGCEASGLGACSTSGARVLGADAAGVYLEYRSGTAAPVLQKSVVPGAPSSVPDEPAASAGKSGETTTGTIDTTVAATSSQVGAIVAALSPPAPRPEVVWGRWSAIATGTPLVSERATQGYKTSFSNPMFGLLVGQGPGTLPREGQVAFNLMNSEAYVRSGSAISAVRVADAQLSVDFGARQFKTGLSVIGAGLDSQFSAAGKVDWQGAMISDASRSTMTVLGALAGAGARDAGYLFNAPLGGGANLYGATNWRR